MKKGFQPGTRNQKLFAAVPHDPSGTRNNEKDHDAPVFNFELETLNLKFFRAEARSRPSEGFPPWNERNPEPARLEPERPLPGIEEARMGSILVVDDERGISEIVKSFLVADGHSVQTAPDAESAMALTRSMPLDVVLTDIILPGASGVDLLRQIRDFSPDIQVIMMTGDPTLGTASESLRLGAADYLQKPVDRHEILKAVRNALHVKNLHEEKRRLEEENKRYTDHLEQLVEMRTRDLAASEASLRQRAEELALLNRLGRKVNESITVDDAVQWGLKEISHGLAPDLALIFLRCGDDLVLRGIFPEQAEAPLQPQHLHKVGTCLCGLAVSEDKAVYSSDLQADPRCTMRECLIAGFRSFGALPLRSGSEVIGVLGIASRELRDLSEHGSFFEALANELSVGLNKSILYDQVQRHAMELKASLARVEQAEAERMELQQHLQRAQRLEALGTLAAGIAHDFNNILGAMIGYTELTLLHTPPESRNAGHLKMVLNAGQRAKDLVRQILVFSRQSEEECKSVQIVHIVNEVLYFMRASLPTTIEIRKDLDHDIGMIMADPVQIHQVLMNLCTNAHHAMSEKGGILDIRVTSVNRRPDCDAPPPGLKPGPYVRLTVKDTGHGMDEATMARIFDPYFTTKEKGVGTGLGLAVVHGIIQKYGGGVTVQSEPGKGAVFDLYFPAIRKEQVLESPVQEDLPTGHESILLVDDDPLHLEVTRKTLEYLGYRVESRSSSVDALSLFASAPRRYDLVVTDATMPAMTGERLAMELMRIREDVHVVLCTGYGEEVMEEKVKAMGIRALIMKPFKIARIARVVRDVLDGKQHAETA
jgi:signal transduction histidine kinase/CheY-like chemotaxis protein